ncbi:MAG TPA: SDR family NAD(P)-dependent oxidoreductase [Candidatus Acidoferrales bacterium]|nr:SDR family NAD(P)-dependent oxidoreductase [Candidatus Acidoferrales bacterium]
MEKPLDGKVALITGSSRGIGLAIARSLGRLGAKLSLCSRHAEKLRSAAAEIRSEGASAITTAADVTRASEIGKLVQKTEQSLGAIDILVNNAGIGYFGPFHGAAETDWDAVLDTNLKAVFLLSKAVAAGMIERRTGHIINIASLAGKNAFAGGAIYCASKWGLLGLTECMAEDLRQYGIRVSVVSPGSVATDFSPHAGKDPRKMLQPEDIAHAVEVIVTQSPQSFISEILLRPTQKP